MCIEKNNCCWAIWQTPSWGIVMKTTTVEFISATHFSFGQKWMLHFHLSTFFLLPFFYFFSLSAMKYWYSTNGNQSTFYSQNSETVKGEKIVIVHSDLDTVGGSTKKLYFVTVNVRKESRYPVLNVHHWTQKKLEGEWHPLHPWLIFGL